MKIMKRAFWFKIKSILRWVSVKRRLARFLRKVIIKWLREPLVPRNEAPALFKRANIAEREIIHPEKKKGNAARHKVAFCGKYAIIKREYKGKRIRVGHRTKIFDNTWRQK